MQQLSLDIQSRRPFSLLFPSAAVPFTLMSPRCSACDDRQTAEHLSVPQVPSVARREQRATPLINQGRV